MSTATYRNRYGDLVCAVHHVRLIVPPPRRNLGGQGRVVAAGAVVPVVPE